MSASKKKILVFIDWYLPGFRAGGPIRSCNNLIAHLGNEFEFSVVTRDTDYHETAPYQDVKPDQWNIIPDGTRVYYFSNRALSVKNIKRILDGEEYDKVYVNGIFSFYFCLLPVILLRAQKQKLVIASRGMFAKGALSVKKNKKTFFLLAVRALGLFRRARFHATNEQERKDIMAHLGGATEVIVAPNLPRKTVPMAPGRKIKDRSSVKLVSIARISPEKNTKYALEALMNAKGQIVFDMYGTVNNEPYWKECREVIAKLPSNVKVNYMGVVPGEQIFERLSEYHFMFMPTLGENFGHIIIESLMSGTPVIISDQTMWKGLAAERAGWDISLLRKEVFARTIGQCAEMDQQEYDSWFSGALNYAKNFLSSSAMVEQNKRLFINE